jgi:hypothetical protein
MAWVIEVTEDAYEDATKFLAALQSAKSKILSSPYAFAVWKNDIRRIVLTPFAYKLYFKIYKEKIVVFLIAHERRSNQYLKRRIQKIR